MGVFDPWLDFIHKFDGKSHILFLQKAGSMIFGLLSLIIAFAKQFYLSLEIPFFLRHIDHYLKGTILNNTIKAEFHQFVNEFPMSFY